MGKALAFVLYCSLVLAGPVAHGQDGKALTSVPTEIPEPAADGIIYLPGASGAALATTINPALQAHLTAFLIDSHAPIAAIVVADAHTGSILAMAQGRRPEEWGGKSHSALHAAFPAASVFKTVVTTAAFEIADFDGDVPLGLTGGCSHVRETGDWLYEKEPTAVSRMSLRTAFGKSCNGFFAKIGVNHLGIGIITNFARRYGWETGVPADFKMERSPFLPPVPQNSSTHTVGRFAAGFGKVGLSAAHAAYIMLSIANRGVPVPLRLFRNTALPLPIEQRPRIFSEVTASRLSYILDASVRGGTASFAFRHGKYRKLHDLVGGKTGTLTGSAPKGITTWFAGMAPVAAPEIVVASVVVLDERWHIKAPNLAAEGFWAYFDDKVNQKAMNTASFVPVAKIENPKQTK